MNHLRYLPENEYQKEFDKEVKKVKESMGTSF